MIKISKNTLNVGVLRNLKRTTTNKIFKLEKFKHIDEKQVNKHSYEIKI